MLRQHAQRLAAHASVEIAVRVALLQAPHRCTGCITVTAGTGERLRPALDRRS